MTQVRFSLGRTVATPGALAALSPEEIPQLLSRHARGDWGELEESDKLENESALNCGEDDGRLLSAYTSASGVKVWIITEADRSATTILLPEEY